MDLQKYFEKFRENTVGIDHLFTTPYGTQKMIYLDWIASGRLYRPIEEKILRDFGPFVGNTHTEATVTGTTMTNAYRQAQKLIKDHVNAGPEDVIIEAGSGMTSAVITLQRILGLRVPEKFSKKIKFYQDDRPMVFITHMEHHSNQISWLETICDVRIIKADSSGLVDLDDFNFLLKKYRSYKLKIASVTAASNVTGIKPPIHKIAKLIHEYRGVCFVDFACAAPYVKINMHPKDPQERLDAIFFSPHKFLGGPGSPGILIFDSKLYKNKIPDRPGGGTVLWTNPWGKHAYLKNIEEREDGGTPPFLQTIKAALCVKLKREMGVSKILEREKELIELIFPKLKEIPGLKILAESITNRLGGISFILDGFHYNLVCKFLNDRFGVQTRGGCACAGTYGHYLFNINKKTSENITDQLDRGDHSKKPGFVRLSVHPINTDKEIETVVKALTDITKHGKDWAKDYKYNPNKNEFIHKSQPAVKQLLF